MRGRVETALANAAPPAATTRNNASPSSPRSRAEQLTLADDDFVAVTVVAIAVAVSAYTLVADA